MMAGKFAKQDPPMRIAAHCLASWILIEAHVPYVRVGGIRIGFFFVATFYCLAAWHILAGPCGRPERASRRSDRLIWAAILFVASVALASAWHGSSIGRPLTAALGALALALAVFALPAGRATVALIGSYLMAGVIGSVIWSGLQVGGIENVLRLKAHLLATSSLRTASIAEALSVLRATGLSHTSYHFGVAVSAGIAWALVRASYATSERRFPQVLLLLGSAIGAFGLFAAGARSAIVATLAVVLWILFRRRRQTADIKSLAVAMLAFAAVGAATVYVTGTADLERMGLILQERLRVSTLLSDPRLARSGQAVALGLRSLPFGVGELGYVGEGPPPLGRAQQLKKSPHNQFLNAFVVYGPAALLSLVWLHAVALAGRWPRHGPELAGSQCVLLAVMVNSLFHNLMLTNTIFLWAPFIMIALSSQEPEPTSSSDSEI